MKPRRNRTEIKRRLQAVINDLVNRVGCTFWACPGPNKPFESGLTCYTCASIKELRKIRDEI